MKNLEHNEPIFSRRKPARGQSLPVVPLCAAQLDTIAAQ